MASAAVSKCIKVYPGKEMLSWRGQAAKGMSETWKTVEDKQWRVRDLPGSVQSPKIVRRSKAIKKYLSNHKSEAMDEKREGHLGKDRERKILNKVCSKLEKRKGETKNPGRTVSHVRKGGLESEIVGKVLAVFATLHSMAALELKVKFRKYSLSLHKVAGRVKIVQCRLTLDVKNCKIKLKIRNSSAIARIIPTTLRQAVTALNVLINRLPLNTEEKLFQLFKTISAATFTADGDHAVMSRDVFSDASNPNVVSPADVISGPSNPSDFLSALKGLDIQILCSSVLKLELKKRKLSSKFGRKMVMISAKEGVEIVKEPRALFRRREFGEALRTLQVWVESCSEFKVAQQVAYIAETIKDNRY